MTTPDLTRFHRLTLRTMGFKVRLRFSMIRGPVQRVFARLGLGSRKFVIADRGKTRVIDDAQIAKLLAIKDIPYRALAERFGCSKGAVENAAKRLGVHRR